MQKIYPWVSDLVQEAAAVQESEVLVSCPFTLLCVF